VQTTLSHFLKALHVHSEYAKRKLHKLIRFFSLMLFGDSQEGGALPTSKFSRTAWAKADQMNKCGGRYRRGTFRQPHNQVR
jgi:hypothetical protein